MFSLAYLRASELYQQALARRGGLLAQYEATELQAGLPDPVFVLQLVTALEKADRRLARRYQTLITTPPRA